jgi:RNA polymerase sigma-70 factor, ECF subfamily
MLKESTDRGAELSSTAAITQLLHQINAGQREAQERLIPIVYGQLRKQAARYMNRERQNHTLEPTALVHEAYLRLIQQQDVTWQDRAHFFALAAQLMKNILVDHARARRAAKRGGIHQFVTLNEALAGADERHIDLLALDEALRRLAAMDPTQTRIVELRFFGGLSVEETAFVLHLSPRTVKRDWSLARAWLFGELRSKRAKAVQI